MKKFALIALIALFVSPVFAADDVNTASATTDVELTIYQYCECNLTGIITDVDSDGDDFAAEFTATAGSRANFDYKLDLEFAWTESPTGAVLPGYNVIFVGDDSHLDKTLGEWTYDSVKLTVDWDLDTIHGDYKGTITLKLAE